MPSHREEDHLPTCAGSSHPRQPELRRTRQRLDSSPDADRRGHAETRSAPEVRRVRTRPSRQAGCCGQAGGECCRKAGGQCCRKAGGTCCKQAGGTCCKKAASQSARTAQQDDAPATATESPSGRGRRCRGDAPRGSQSRCSRDTAASGKHSDEALQRMRAVLRGTGASDIRCPGCGSLMARAHGTSLVMQRGGVLSLVEGDAEVTFVCYRRSCGLWTTVQTGRMKAVGGTGTPV